MNAAPKLLVVDDEPDLRTLYELTLVREGYDVDSAGTVEEAWARLLAGHYSAVITDMRLPDGTGLGLLRRIEAAGRSEKVIVITAYGSAENAVEALKAGAFDYTPSRWTCASFAAWWPRRWAVRCSPWRQPAPCPARAGGWPRPRPARPSPMPACCRPHRPAPTQCWAPTIRLCSAWWARPRRCSRCGP